MNTNNKYFKEFKQEGTILLKNIIETDQFFNIDTLLKKKFRKFSIDDPYSEDCAKFAIQNSKEISKIYDETIAVDEVIGIKNLKIK
jgi:purine nucleoside phosphorylase